MSFEAVGSIDGNFDAADNEALELAFLSEGVCALGFDEYRDCGVPSIGVKGALKPDMEDLKF